MARGIRLGPGNPVEQWLHAYHNGDVNQHAELDAWRKGEHGWVIGAPRQYRQADTPRGLSQGLTYCPEAII